MKNHTDVLIVSQNEPCSFGSLCRSVTNSPDGRREFEIRVAPSRERSGMRIYMDIQPTEKKNSVVKNIFLIVGVIVALAVIALEVRAVTLPENRALRRVNLGNRYLSELKYEEAIAEFDLAINIDPKNVDAYLGKAEAYVQMDDIDRAIEALAEGYDETEDTRLRRAMEELSAQRQEDADEADVPAPEQESGAKEEAEDQTQDAVDVDEVIVWHDAEIERWTRETLGIPEGDIRRSDVQGITEMEIEGPWYEIADGYYDVKSIEDLASFTGLTSLAITNCDISDINALGGLMGLENLSLDLDSISDISALSNLTNLKTLSICNGVDIGDTPYSNYINDFSALSSLSNLTSLDLDGNQISDVSVLGGLTNLTSLSLWANDISDVSALGSLTNLTSLNLEENRISDVSALSGLTNLQYLYLYNNNISDVSALGSLTNLEELSLASNQISDVSALSGLTNLQYLYLYNNNISDVSALGSLTNLQGLWLGGNSIEDFSPVSFVEMLVVDY